MEDEEARFDELEAEFSHVLHSLSGDKSLERFHAEYGKVFNALRGSHENERRLVKKVKELHNEIVVNASKVATALKLSEEDSTTIDELKKQVERAWSMVEAANAREESANHAIERLQDEVNALHGSLLKHQQLLGADTSIEDLITARDVLTARVRELEAAVASEKARADEVTTELAGKQEKYREKKAHITELERQLAAKAAEEARDAKKRTNLEAEVGHLKEQLAARMAAGEALKKAIEESEARSAALDKKLTEQRHSTTAATVEFKKAVADVEKLSSELDEQQRQVALLKEERGKWEREGKMRMEEVSRERANVARLQSRLDAETREKERITRALDDERLACERLRSEVEAARKTLDQEHIRAKATERVLARLDRDKAAAEKRVGAEAGKVVDARHEVEAKAEEVAGLETENRRLMLEATKMRTVISVLERDRERIRQGMEEMERRWKESQEEVRARDTTIADLERKELESAARWKQSQTAYESLRSEKTLLNKELLQAQDDLTELRRKCKVQTGQIESLKEDIHAKDRALVAEEFEHQSVEKRLDQRNQEVEQLKRLMDEANVNITKQDNEIVDLNATIRRMDAEALAQKRAYDQVVTERDILGTQLIRRNDELALLYEKLSIQTSTLTKGEAQYKERVEDIRLLKIKVADLRRELTLATASAGVTGDLKREVARLQRELLQEQTKVKALSEELENPMNVHRWRKLEGSDPATYEMVLKIQTLQRRLIAKTEEVVERDMMLAEREKMYAEVKAVLARQPGPEVAEALAHYQHLLNERTRQLKALASEMQMYQAQMVDSRYEIDRLTRQLLDAKKSYYDLKNRERAATSGSASVPSATVAFGSRGTAGTGREDGGMGGSGDGGTGGPGVSSTARPADLAARLADKQRAAATGAVVRFVGGGFNVHAA